MTSDHSQLLDQGLVLVEWVAAYAKSRGWDYDPRDILDVIWLAGRRESATLFESAEKTTPLPVPPPLPTPNPPAAENSPPPAVPRPDSTENDEPETVEVYAAARKKKAAKSVTRTIDLPAPPPFPNKRSFLQACRPLMLRGPSRNRRTLDVEATARRWAEEFHQDVVERPIRERQVRLILVLDFTTSMDMWRSLLRDLSRTLHNCGGFRRVESVCMVSHEQQVLLTSVSDASSSAPTRRPARMLRDEGQQLTLIVSDCISPHWDSENWIERLRSIGEWSALGILQVLPEQLWPHTALGQADSVRVQSCKPLQPGMRIQRIETADERFERELLQEGLDPVPDAPSMLLVCSPITPRDYVAGMSRFLTGRLPFPVPGFNFRPKPPPASGQEPSRTSTVGMLNGSQALDEFLTWASRPALELAKLLAASPAISLPIARLLQHNFLRSAVAALPQAEIWTAGLLETLEDADDADPEQQLYRYRDGIRDRLLDGVTIRLRQRILETSSEYIESNLGRATGLRAMLENPAEYAGQLQTGAGSDPIAIIAADILRRQGAEFANLAARRSRRMRPVVDLATLRSHILHEGTEPCHRFAWSPDGETLAIPWRDGRVSYWPLKRINQSHQVSSRGLNAVSWSPDGNRVAIACFSRVVRIFDRPTATRLELQGHQSDITAVAFSPDGIHLASGTAAGEFRVWNTQSRRDYTAQGTEMVYQLAWLGAEHIAVASRSATTIYRLSESKLVAVARTEVPTYALAVVNVTSQQWLPAGELLALGLAKGEIVFWDWRANRRLDTSVFSHTSTITSMDVSSDGVLLASKARDGSVTIVRLDTGHVCGRLQTEAGLSHYSAVAFRPQSSTLAVSSHRDLDVELYDLSSLIGKSMRPTQYRIRAMGSPVDTDTPQYKEFLGACYEIGREFARRGHSLVISTVNEQKADPYVLNGYFAANRPGGQIVLVRANHHGFKQADTWIRSKIEKWDISTHQRDTIVAVADAINDAIPDRHLRSILDATAPDSASELQLSISLFEEVHQQLLGREGWKLINNVAALLPGNRLIAEFVQLVRNLDDVSKSKMKYKFIELESESDVELEQAQSLFQCDAVIVIGGGRHSTTVCKLAEQLNVPMLPIGNFGGIAAGYYVSLPRISMGLRFSSPPSPRSDLLGEGRPWENDTAKQVVDLVEQEIRAIERPTVPESICHVGTDDDAQWRSGIVVGPRIILTAALGLAAPWSSGPSTISVRSKGVEQNFLTSLFSIKAVPYRTREPQIQPSSKPQFALVTVEANGDDSSILFPTHQPLDGFPDKAEIVRHRIVEVVASTRKNYAIQRGIIGAVHEDQFEVWTGGPAHQGLLGASVMLVGRSTPFLLGIAIEFRETPAGVVYYVASLNASIVRQIQGEIAESRLVTSPTVLSLEIPNKDHERKKTDATQDTVGAIDLAEATTDTHRRSLEASFAYARRMIAEIGDTPQTLRDIYHALVGLANLDLAEGDRYAARRKLEESLKLSERISRQFGPTPENHHELNLSLVRLADLDQAEGDLSAARSKLEESLELSRRFINEFGVTSKLLTDVGRLLKRIADVTRKRREITAHHLMLIYSTWHSPKMYEKYRRRTYGLQIIVEAAPEVLDRIESVRYDLPGWPEPEEVVTDRSTKFKLEQLAWRTTTASATIKIKGQDRVIELSQFIELRDSGPRI